MDPKHSIIKGLHCTPNFKDSNHYCFIHLGFGGQIDFIRGAALSLDGEGKPIIACTSTTDDGTSRIVPMLKLGEFVIHSGLK